MGQRHPGEPAKEIAALAQDRDPTAVLADGDIASSAEIAIKLRIRSIESLETPPMNVTDAAAAARKQEGIRPSTILYSPLQSSRAPRPKSAPFCEAGAPSDLRKRPWPRGLGRLLSPPREMVNSLSKELAGKQAPSPPYSSYCARDASHLP